jgi:hypothetical protein
MLSTFFYVPFSCFNPHAQMKRNSALTVGFNTPPLGVKLGHGGFVPPHTIRFQGDIFNTPLCGDFLFKEP